MKYHSPFLGIDYPLKNTEYSGGDSKELFEENLKIMPDDWYYRDATIKYNYNSYGHRCAELADIDLDNYILFAGCSHTEGLGLELEKTYPHLLAEQLNTDYYNLGLSAVGLDLIEYNLISWFLNITKKPKLVVIQWPDHSRFASLYPDCENLIEQGSWTDEKSASSFVVSAENTGFFNARKKITRQLLMNIIDVPVCEIHFNDHADYSKECVWLKRIDYARDLCHAGIESHKSTTRQIVEHLNR